MKFRKNSASAKMEIAMTAEHSLNPRISRTFKRSKSFRASTRFMSKFQNQTNLRAVDEIEKRSSLSPLELIRKTEENADSKTVDVFMAQFYSHSESKEMTDLRGIVQEVKNKLSITMRSRRKNREEPGSVVDSLRSENKMADKKSSIGTSKYERTNNYCKSVNEFHSYENPTFDSSFDTSVSACLYKDEPDNLDDCGNLETADKKDSRGGKSNDEEEAVTIIVGNEARRFVESGDSRFPTTAPSGVPTDKPIAREIQTTWSSHRPPCGKHEKIYDNTFSGSKSTNNSSSWLISRGSSFRFRTANGCTTGSAGSLTSGATTVSKFHTFQGMEFLEGFGKKKHLPSNNQPNTLSVNINPLTAQPSHNIHVHALFSAVEHGHLDKARTILESTDVDVNSVNSDGLSALDVAVLGSNKSLAKMLVAFGAQEGNRFESPESLGSHMASLLLTAEQRVQELGGTTTGNSILDPANCRNDFTTSHNSLTRCTEPTDEKQLALWERRVRALRKMLLGFEQARPPDVPLLVAVDVTGTTSIVLKFQESEVHESSICTKFKVQWSTCDDFTNICGERQVMDMKQRECRIDRLSQGQRYHLRVAAGNIKGWSRYAASTPAYVTPSSWRDLENKQPRYFGRVDQLETVFSSIRRPEYGNEAPALQRRNHKKKTTTIKQLFSATSKFQKTLRRGVFLACLLYHEDKILVTNEDFLPVIEVDETYSPSCIYNDFHWLMKVSCTWNDVKSLRHDMEKCQGSSSNHLKMKLLQAAGQMQAALCVQDLGQIYHKPLRDVHGTMVISIVNYVKSPKSVSVLNGRWLPLNKVNKKTIAHDNNNVADILMNSIQSQMAYHQLSSIKLTRGLYLGYLKMQSSVDFVQVFVSAKAPNILPHCKIRDNPHVSAEEWEYLKRITRIPSSETSQAKVEEKENAVNESSQGTEQQKLFVDLVSATSRRLFSYMNVTAEDSQIHRLYDAEVIELTSQVSLIVVVPPPEVACSAPGTREVFLQRDDLLSLPIQVFEMVHLSTYQKKMINLYSRLSCILELDTAQARHNHREAFSSTELSVAKERLANLQDLQCQINTIWKGARWLVDLITFARDRGTSGQLHLQTSGISMKSLLSIDKNRNKNSGSTSSNNNINTNGGHSLKRSLLQLPPRDPKLVKSSPGRGSWPGPNLLSSSTSSNLLTTELSKSEQQLPNGGATGHYTRKVSHDATNFTSELSAAKFSGNRETSKLSGRLPISKSEDSILLTKYKHSPRNRSVNSLTLVSGNASPAINTKTFAYGRTFVPTSMTNTSSIATTTSDSMHSLNGAGEDYTFGNSNQAHGKTKSIKPTASVAAVATPSLEDQLDRKKQDEATVMPAPLPGILQVYAAYETGLASGTSLKLHVTPRTTAREVVDLVVKQLNMAIVLKGQEGPIYTADQLPNFCLVAVIGARERCLRDDFKPLQLQNPWKKGRLYVRQKQDVLAALEHSSKQTAYL